MSRPIAIAISDIHLSLLRPACRADKDWMFTQAFYLDQLREIASGLPILVAGDLFNKWNAPPELINFALKHLPDEMLCVPGQHDLPEHRIDLMHRSGYGVLKEAKKIIDLSSYKDSNKNPCYVPENGNFVVRGFGWNQKIGPPVYDSQKMVNTPQIALIHRYCWKKGKSYPGAPEELHVGSIRTQGYDVMIFGDNHAGFIEQYDSGPVILNCGGFIRRKSDEIHYQPSVGIVYSDGTVKRHKLDTSIDKFHENPEKREEVAIDMKAFIDRLESLGEHGLNFVEAVETALRDGDYDEETKEIILSCVDNKGEK